MMKSSSAGFPTAQERPTLSLYPETAKWMGLSKSSVYAAAERGEIPTIRLGRRLLVPTATLRRMLALDVDTEPGSGTGRSPSAAA
jgi:excisionase family DNA binding protein